MAKVRKPLVTSEYVVDLCKGVAEVIPTKDDPATHNANVARMLFMVAAHESIGFRTRRQDGFSRESTRGAFSFWQIEWPSVELSLENLITRPLLEVQVGIWMSRYGLPARFLDPANKAEVLLVLQEETGDPLGALFARLHHKWYPAYVPACIYEMGKYCKAYHNTDRGKARPRDYVEAFQKYWPGKEEACTGIA